MGLHNWFRLLEPHGVGFRISDFEFQLSDLELGIEHASPSQLNPKPEMIPQNSTIEGAERKTKENDIHRNMLVSHRFFTALEASEVGSKA